MRGIRHERKNKSRKKDKARGMRSAELNVREINLGKQNVGWNVNAEMKRERMWGVTSFFV